MTLHVIKHYTVYLIGLFTKYKNPVQTKLLQREGKKLRELTERMENTKMCGEI